MDKNISIKKKIVKSYGVRSSVEREPSSHNRYGMPKKEIGCVYLFIMKKYPTTLQQSSGRSSSGDRNATFGLLENLYVHPNYRDKGLGTKLTKEVIKEAKKRKCYKLICTSRYGREYVHKLYKKLGFKDWGKEFRIDYK